MTESDNKGLSWGGLLVLLLFSVAMGPGMIVFSFAHYRTLQNPPPGMKVHWLEYVLIRTLGPWSILVLGLVVGVAMSALAVGSLLLVVQKLRGEPAGLPAPRRDTPVAPGPAIRWQPIAIVLAIGGATFALLGILYLRFSAADASRQKREEPTPVVAVPPVLPADPAEAAALEALRTHDVSHRCDDQQPGRPVVELSFYVARPGPGDADLAPLKAFPRLRLLRLSSTAINGSGLAPLRGLGDLQELDLGWTKCTDDSLAHLKDCKSLRVLRLSSTPIDGSGLVHLRGLDRLRELDLGFTQLTDANLVHLEGLNGLERLELPWTRIGNAGLAHLQGLTRLRHLNLDGDLPAVTDEGLVHLEKLKDLHELKVSPARRTSGGIARLQGALPRLKVVVADR
jgi:hypothetical protein